MKQLFPQENLSIEVIQEAPSLKGTIDIDLAILPRIKIHRSSQGRTTVILWHTYGEFRFVDFGDDESSPSMGTMRAWVLSWVARELTLIFLGKERVERLMELINQMIDELAQRQLEYGYHGDHR